MTYSFALPTYEYLALIGLLPEHCEAAIAFLKANQIIAGEYFRIECNESGLAEILTVAMECCEDTAKEIMRQLRSQKAPIKRCSVLMDAVYSNSFPKTMVDASMVQGDDPDPRSGTFD